MGTAQRKLMSERFHDRSESYQILIVNVYKNLQQIKIKCAFSLCCLIAYDNFLCLYYFTLFFLRVVAPPISHSFGIHCSDSAFT